MKYPDRDFSAGYKWNVLHDNQIHTKMNQETQNQCCALTG